MNYKIEIKETLSRIIEIEAENGSEAIIKAKSIYGKQEVILDSGDYVEAEFNVYKD